ncbi:thioredoxin peroxidase [Candidatus Photodesmus blepharus]|uniref:thioredoxin-dependent peroxiredoxin n=1 Tax=Candidatus Photodesmus blepharonis TaxID=1179155 RepID=A0A084CP22_9GAMM|nr:thioredoxin-dependent thiol peroxidase [Candidatus Photodesmus blepharus]KEY91551.1 thioredoxin peroxidase [Candidatus Photodesmus blepharus]
MRTLKSGVVAPDFFLLNQDGKTVSLSGFLDKKVLLYFYPKAMSPGCTLQAKCLRDVKTKLEMYGVTILGISTDPVECLRKFIEHNNLTFTLLSDENHIVAEQFGVWGKKKFMGKIYDGLYRFSFLIDKQGMVEHIFKGFKIKSHHKMILDYLEKNR